MKPYLEYFQIAERALGAGFIDEAIDAASVGLNQHPGNVPLMFSLGYALIKKKRFFEASVVFENITEASPDSDKAWINLMRCYSELLPYDEKYIERSGRAFEKAKVQGVKVPAFYSNMSFSELLQGNYEEAFRHAQEALKLDQSNTASLYNMGIAYLFNHAWEEGWYCYDATLSSRYASGVPNYNLPRWEGQEGATVIVCGEQGLGDEIMFASMVPDIQKHCTVIIDTVPKLAGLFRRSFDCEVWSTRLNAQPTDRADFWTPMGSLGGFYRTGDFPGTQYLQADPERRIQYRALLDSLSAKPKIGISWSGGTMRNNELRRSLTLNQLSPILEYDAEWVSLQYKNTDCPDFVHHWPRATADCDYDETAALISELDLIISVTTTAIHCAGALGKETWCLVPDRPQWRYGAAGDRMPWYDSVELLRQEDEWPIEEVCNRLSRMGIGKCRNLSTNRPITVLPRKATRALSPPLSKSAGLERFLITGLGKAA